VQFSKIQQLEIPVITPIKRSKRREGSVDEDSSTRAQCLKAKKNLDAPVLSEVKSFLSFPNARIKSTITSGISIGNDVDKGMDNIKELLEYKRMLDAANLESKNKVQNTSDVDDVSDVDRRCD
jgi:hypothetical protein